MGYPPETVFDLHLRGDAVNAVDSVGGSGAHLVPLIVQPPLSVDSPVVQAVRVLQYSYRDECTAVFAVLAVGDEYFLAVLERDFVTVLRLFQRTGLDGVGGVQLGDDQVQCLQVRVDRIDQRLELSQLGVGFSQFVLNHARTAAQHGKENQQGTRDPCFESSSHNQ